MKTAGPSVLLLDHFDSFTYNLVQYCEELGAKVQVVRTDQPFSSIQGLRPTHVVLSPGPGHPKDAGLFHQAIDFWQGKVPILGVCLGHQAIAEYYGAKVVRNYRQMHGKTSVVCIRDTRVDFCRLFAGLHEPFTVCRYHSLVVDRDTIPDEELKILAWTPEGEIMALQHRTFIDVIGVQFHPESIFTQEGGRIIKNFLTY
jgi:anthranilate synthase/aminodeoxychorismate synthase-like glutamine amidotransferase